MHIADDGEIWLNGDNVFQGYLNNPKATDETLQDGWPATGDLGALDEDGYLTITGRKKEILVTSGGKSVSPVCWRSASGTIRWSTSASSSATTGPYVAALITLDQEAVEHWLTMRNKPQMTPTELVHDADLETEVRRAVVAANTLVSQAESIRTFRHPRPAVHRGARAADALAETEAQGHREGLRQRGRGAVHGVTSPVRNASAAVIS